MGSLIFIMERQRLSSLKRLHCQILLKVKLIRTEDLSEPGASGTEAVTFFFLVFNKFLKSQTCSSL